MEFAPTQTQKDYVPESGDGSSSIMPEKPWGRLCPFIANLGPVDLFAPSYTFGRAPDCQIVLPETINSTTNLTVSRRHFIIEKTDDDLICVTDLSKNGTFINENVIGKNLTNIIQHNDVIAVGHSQSKVYQLVRLNREDDYPKALTTKYVISKKIGKGAFGQVHLAYDKATLEKVAIKRINKSATASSIASEKIRTETEILATYTHPFIISMLESHHTRSDVFLVLEYMEGGELTNRILSSEPFPEDEVKFVFYQMLQAVRYLHSNAITHRDLKPENILMQSKCTYPMIKITDFGLSKIMDDVSLMETVCGTVSYAAPEVLRSVERYDMKVDIWSLGCILFYMLTRNLPFVGESKQEVARKVLSGQVSYQARCWKFISESAKDLVKGMLVTDKCNRFSTTQCFKHQWIEKDVEMRRQVEALVVNLFESSEEEILRRRSFKSSDEEEEVLRKRVRLE